MSIFRATCADTFGSKYAAGNSGTPYTAKGTAPLLVPLVPLASALSAGAGWNRIFLAAAIINIIAGVSGTAHLALL